MLDELENLEGYKAMYRLFKNVSSNNIVLEPKNSYLRQGSVTFVGQWVT